MAIACMSSSQGPGSDLVVLPAVVRLQSSTALLLNHCDGTFHGGEWGRTLADTIVRHVFHHPKVVQIYLGRISIDSQT